MAKTGPQKYPGASTAYWYQSKWGGDSMESNVIVWHTTEGTSLPSYSGGSSAPNFTAVPDFGAKKLRWYQHFDFDTSSRALVNKSGGVSTNTLNVVQVELVGTCDPSTHKKWGSTQHLYTPELPDWVKRDLAAFAKWANTNHGVPLSSDVSFKAYPGSYGSNGVRMSFSKWNSYKGHCGHQHVPENDHGDPGLFPMNEILSLAKGNAPKTNTENKETSMEPVNVWAYKGNSKLKSDGGGKETEDAYNYLRTIRHELRDFARYGGWDYKGKTNYQGTGPETKDAYAYLRGIDDKLNKLVGLLTEVLEGK